MSLSTSRPPVGLAEPSERAVALHQTLLEFVRDRVLPSEHEYETYRTERGQDDHTVPPVVEELKQEAKALGLWNLFLPDESGLTQLEYAPLAELTGWCHEMAPEAVNCQAPDTGNMELLHLFGTETQREQWLEPLLAGTIRSAFAMTEPGVASSDATNIATRIERDGDSYVVNGRKWWVSGAADPRCRVLIVLGRSAEDDAPPHCRHTMLVVPVETPGVRNVRSVPVFGRQDQHGHCEVVFEDVRVPIENVLGEEGGGFAAAQARLGPGRIHHCMRALGAGERALALMVERAIDRHAFGGPLSDRGVVREQIAESRLDLDQARLLCHQACQIIDTQGNAAARDVVALAKIAVPRAVTRVLDRAIQVHGGAGVSDDTPLAAMWGWHRAMRIFDGPDEVHLRALARSELRRASVLPPRPQAR